MPLIMQRLRFPLSFSSLSTDRARQLSWRGAVRACALSMGLAFAAGAPVVHAQQITQPMPRLPTVNLTAGMHVIHAEVAVRPEHRARGLMFREQLGQNEGMLFIFDDTAIQCMWMRNTLVPLSVAFIADDGTIVNIEDMAPKTEESHCGAKRLRYALEMEQGWFAKRGLKAGTVIKGIPK
jgi:uncharacterized membrane protein (UPF0127 family)